MRGIRTVDRPPGANSSALGPLQFLIWRKLYHLAAGGLYVAALAWLSLPLFIALGSAYLLLFYARTRHVSYAALAVMLLLALSGSTLVTQTGALIWVVGDGVSALAGTWWGRRPLPWHPGKTVAGSAACLLGGWLAAALFLSSRLPPGSGIPTLFVLSLVPALAGALVEGLPLNGIGSRRPDDNLLMILVCGAVFRLLAAGRGLEIIP